MAIINQQKCYESDIVVGKFRENIVEKSIIINKTKHKSLDHKKKQRCCA
jgi:hypothetical protein